MLVSECCTAPVWDYSERKQFMCSSCHNFINRDAVYNTNKMAKVMNKLLINADENYEKSKQDRTPIESKW